MAKTLSRQASANGRARLTLWLDAPLKEQLACAAFARGVPAATVVSEALRQYLDATAPDAGSGGPRRTAVRRRRSRSAPTASSSTANGDGRTEPRGAAASWRSRGPRPSSPA